MKEWHADSASHNNITNSWDHVGYNIMRCTIFYDLISGMTVQTAEENSLGISHNCMDTGLFLFFLARINGII